MGTLLNVTHDEQHINFKNEDINFYGYTTYSEEVWEKIKDLNWRVNDEEFKNGDKTYIYTGSSRFGKYKDLHQVIMLIWYGEEKIKEAYKNGFIVEHHDNNAFNCLIENLSFASNHLNIAKAHTYDIERPRLIDKVTVDFFKCFKTGKYQITLGFNQPCTKVIDSKEISIMAMFLVYKDNFRRVYEDASRIVSDLIESDSFDLNLRFDAWYYEPAIPVYAKEGQNLPPIAFTKDGEAFFISGDNTEYTASLNKISPRKELYNKNE